MDRSIALLGSLVLAVVVMVLLVKMFQGQGSGFENFLLGSIRGAGLGG